MSSKPYPLVAVVLAAGKGKRMKSDLPKVLHLLAGKPIIEHVLDTLRELDIDKTVVVVGHQAERVIDAISRFGVSFAEQKQQLGTGHAVQMTEEQLSDFDGDVVVLAGDVPMLRAETVKNLLAEHRKRGAVATVLTAMLPDPTGYGRIVRDPGGMILKIVEHKDASDDERRISEINTGIFVFEKKRLFEALSRVDNENSQGEYYLTDVMQIFLEQGLPTAGYCAEDYRETVGVNSTDELERLEALMGKSF
ncbi:MAG: NTP transferase domain-containing protein [candidate division Zixibacteria bacterium]|nr:NTP transferase domain-containing protein [candidate division Zixibacteria bacterium]MBU1469502.1 NTP transferase domain-containing protein [candidate division Zixibacteria bacterium]MBU2625569.1 NTP transferase domain-containing protein [candidate division Zixibacteria bacterium]